MAAALNVSEQMASKFGITACPCHNDFLRCMQAAVPKFMQLRLEPASGSTLQANSSDAVKQTLHVKNSMHGQKSLVMRLRISYALDGSNKLEQAEVKNFPAGL